MDNDGVAVRAGGRRFWVTVLVFAVLNAAIWVGYHHLFGPGSRAILRVEHFSPGDRAVVGARPTFEWTFNLDLPGDLHGGSPVSIQPALAGQWRWRGARDLVFLPDRDLPKATQFTFTLAPDRLRTAQGFSLRDPFITTVGTAPLRVLHIRQDGFLENARYVLRLEFDDAVIPADVLARLTLKGADGRPIGFKEYGTAVGKVVRVLTDSIPFTESAKTEPIWISVELKAGLAGMSGPLGMPAAYSKKLALGQALAATGISASSDGHGRPDLFLQFNGAVDPLVLKEILSVEPAVSIQVNQDYRGVRLVGDFKPGSRYAVKLAAAPKGADARKYPRADVLSVFVPNRAPGAWFEHETGYLGSKGNRTLLAHAVNLSELRVRLWRVYDGNLVEWRNASGNYRWNGDSETYAKPIASRIVALKSDRNVIQDVRIALDDLLPADVPRDGVFRVGLSGVGRNDDEDESGNGRTFESSSSAVVTLSDIALTAKRQANGLVIWATSLSSAKPLEGVRLRVFSSKNQLLAEGQTNRDGLATLDSVRPAEGEIAAVVLADRVAIRNASGSKPTTESTTAPTTAPATTQAGLTALAARHPADRDLTWMDLRGATWDLADADVSGRPWRHDGFEAYVYTDRGVYRPGDLVHLRAIVRRADGGAVRAMPVSWLIRRPDLREWKRQLAQVDADGSAGLELTLPPDLATGQWTAEIGLPGEPTAKSVFGSNTFLVEEFMPNRLKVAVGFAGKSVDVVKPSGQRRASALDDSLGALVKGDYLFGRPATGLQTTLSARLDPSGFRPSQWVGWTFGDWAQVLESSGKTSPGALEIGEPGKSPELALRALDEKGEARWPLHLNHSLRRTAREAASGEGEISGPVPGAPARLPTTRSATTQAMAAAQYRGPWRLSVRAGVQETGGRTVSAADSIELDALPWYIGVRKSSATPIAPGSPATFEAQLVRPNGQSADEEAQLQVSLLRITWNNVLTFRDGRYRYESQRILEPSSGQPALRIAGGRGKMTITAPDSGEYAIRVFDPVHGAMTTLVFYASNGSGWDDNVSREHPERLEIVVLPAGSDVPTTRPTSAKASASPALKVGSAARVLIRSPFAGRLLLTVETDKVISARILKMTGSSVEVPIEISESMRNGAYVTASVIRAVDPDAKWRTHRACGTTRLDIDQSDRKLAVEVLAPTEARPLSAPEMGVRLRDVAGAPVANASVTLAAVDEGILQLTEFRTPDPLAFFYAPRALGVSTLDVYGQLMPETPRADGMSAAGGDRSGAMPRYHSPVSARRVRPVALFATLKTNEQGIASTHLSIPEFSGRLRVMAVAHQGTQFGAADRAILVRSPILVQSTFPRFAAPGDRFVAPVTIFNNGTKDLQVTLRAELSGASERCPLALSDSQGPAGTWRVSLKAGSQQVVNVSCIAGANVGVAQVRLTATAGNESCTETTELPIRAASPQISRGGYAIVKPDHPESLALRDEFVAGTEQSSVTLSPMPPLQLAQGLDYLERYPYGCAEQTISGSIALLYLNDIGPHIAPGMFSKERVADKVQSGILHLLGMQTADGGLSMWPGGRESWPWASVYGAHFLIEAKAAGHAVPPEFQKRLMKYVRGLLDQGDDSAERVECQAYAAYVLALSGKPDRGFMSRLNELTRPRAAEAREGGDASERAQGRLYLSLAWLASGRKDLASELLPAAPVAVRKSRQGGGNVGSPVRDRAMMLNALLSVRPDDPMIPALAEQLAEVKWQSTQDVAFSAMAIGKYLHLNAAREPYESGELALDGSIIASGDDALNWVAPAHSATPAAMRNFVASIRGPESSRGYLAWTRSGVPKAIPANEDHGVKVRRRYLDEQGRPLASNQVHSGDLILVELSVESNSPLKNLVIEDLLPAGLEIENAKFATSAKPDRPLAEAQAELSGARLDVRDDRMIVFGELSRAGMARQVFAARAVVAGTFVLPPVRAECMYDPGTCSLWGPGGSLEVKPLESRTIVEAPIGE